MHKHLQSLVLSQVEVGVLIHRLCLTLGQLLYDESQCLLVVLHELRLRGVGHTTYSRRQHIVHRQLVGVLLDVDICCFEFAGGCGGCSREVLLVCAPFATHEVKATESQHYRFLPSREEHSHESYARQVADRSHFFAVGRIEWNAEFIPLHVLLVSVAQSSRCLTYLGEIVLSHPTLVEVLWAQAHLVLIVSLIFVERIVLVDVLHVGCCLV